MKKILFFLCYCLLLRADYDPIIITLGENCSITAALETIGLKQESYPFEANITSFQALYDCLLDDFQEFTNSDFFIPYTDLRNPINRYGIVLAHDFPLISLGFINEKLVIDPNWRNVVPRIQAKYTRRINRFREACLSQRKVYFFRYLGINRAQAAALSNLIHTAYPELDFTLVCVTHGENTGNWEIPRVINFYRNLKINDFVDWQRICHDLELIEEKKLDT